MKNTTLNTTNNSYPDNSIKLPEITTDPKENEAYARNCELFQKYWQGKEANDEDACKDVLNAVILQLADLISKFSISSTYKDTDSVQELKQECGLAVCESFCEYNPDCGSLTTFFYPRFRDKVINYVNWKTNKSSKHYSNQMNAVRHSINRIQAKGFAVSVEAIACDTGLSEDKVRCAMDRITYSKEVYYEQYLRPDSEEMTSGDAFDMVTGRSSASAEDEVISQESKKIIKEALAKQPADGLKMFLMYNGLEPYTTKYSYSKIARIFGNGMTPAKVSRSIEQVKFQLKHDRNLISYFDINTQDNKLMAVM